MEQLNLYRLQSYGATRAILQSRQNSNYNSRVANILNTNTLEQQVKQAHQQKLSTLGTIGSVGTSVAGFAGGQTLQAVKRAKKKLTKKDSGDNQINEGTENEGDFSQPSELDTETPFQDFLYGRRELGEADIDRDVADRFAEPDDEEIAGETSRIFGGGELETPEAPSIGEVGLARLTEGGTQTEDELPASLRSSASVEDVPTFRASELESAEPDFGEPVSADIVDVETLAPRTTTGISRLEPSSLPDNDPYAIFRSASDGGRGFLNPPAESKTPDLDVPSDTPPDSAPNFFGRLFGKSQNQNQNNSGSGEVNPAEGEIELSNIGEGAEAGANVAEAGEAVAETAGTGAEVAGGLEAVAGTAEGVAVGADATALATSAIPFLDIVTAGIAGIATLTAVGIGAGEAIRTLDQTDNSGKQVQSKIASIEQPPVQSAGKFVGQGGQSIYA